MPSFNSVVLAGHLTRDPEMRYLPSQTAVVSFGLAVNRNWKDKDGNKREEVCFVDCTAFGRSAETINEYCAKGRAMLVSGRLKQETWDDKDGQRRSKHVVVVEAFQFLGGERQGEGRRERQSDARPGRQERDLPDGWSEDDIPF